MIAHYKGIWYLIVQYVHSRCCNFPLFINIIFSHISLLQDKCNTICMFFNPSSFDILRSQDKVAYRSVYPALKQILCFFCPVQPVTIIIVTSRIIEFVRYFICFNSPLLCIRLFIHLISPQF